MSNSFKRISRASWLDFSRNLGLSFATISIMTIVVLMVTFLFFFNRASNILVSEIKDKVDVSAYFKSDAIVDDIFSLRDELLKMPEVEKADYTSKEQALEDFMEKHQNDSTIIESIREIGDNPLVASLNIKAKDSSQYEKITQFLIQEKYKDLVEKVDYYDRKPVVDKIFAWMSLANGAGIIFSLIFAFIAILVAFNTVRLAIYNASEEIKTMRLVGASNWFVRGPFVFQGVIVGIISVVAAFILTFLFCLAVNSKVSSVMPEINTLKLFWSNILLLLLIQIVSGIGLGVISSMIAIRRNLKI